MSGSAVELPAADAAFNTRLQRSVPRPSSLRADQAAGRLGRTSGEEGAEASRTHAVGSAAALATELNK
jgi:hypothetical protein